jgi:hypothetical protein
VGDLMVAIKQEKEHIVGVDTNTFDIWKVCPPGMCRLRDLTFG